MRNSKTPSGGLWGTAKVLWGVSALLLGHSAAQAADPPEVLAARAVYQQVQGLLKSGALKKRAIPASDSEKTTECGCAPYAMNTGCEMRVDQAGVVRLFTREGGSDDSAMQEAYYYDAAGRLRFTYVHMGAVNNTVQEHRIYYSESGQRVRSLLKTVEGQGYTFPTIWPAYYEVRKPALPLPVLPVNAKTCPQ